MAKKVWLIRHAKQNAKQDINDVWQVNAELFPESIERIKVAAQYFEARGVHFSIFRHSLLTRSQQTCALLMDTMGVSASMGLNEKLGPGEVAEWNKCFADWMTKNPGWEQLAVGPATWAALWPSLCESEGERVLMAVEEIACEIKDGENAAAISHNPLIQLAEGQATGMISGADLKHCQAICFTFEGEELVECKAHLF